MAHKTDADDALYALYFGVQLLLSLVGIYGAWYSNVWLVGVSTLAYCFHGMYFIFFFMLTEDNTSWFSRMFVFAYAFFGIQRHIDFLVLELRRHSEAEEALLEEDQGFKHFL
jgi:hypothetical protein